MSISLLTNTASTVSRNNLSSVSTQLQQSLARLSSGSKITQPSDDAGGLAVSMKMNAAIKRQAAANQNIGNAVSYLQTQDGALAIAGDVLNRISELKTLSQDVTKNASDKANYNSEFQALQAQLRAIADESFNGISLFRSSALAVSTSIDGSGTSVSLDGIDLLGNSAKLFDDFSPALNDTSEFTPQSLGGIGSSMNISGGSISFNIATGGNFSATSGQQFSGPFSMSFDSNRSPGTGGVLDVSIGSDVVYTEFAETGSRTVTLEYDGSELSIYKDGVLDSSSTVGTLSGALKFESIGGIGFNHQISNVTATSTNPAGEYADVANASSLDTTTLDTITTALEDVSTFRAQNGAQQSRLNFAREQIATNQSNLEAANSRIVDVDVASESTQLARLNVLQQAGASMLSQANQSQQIALRLLG